MQRSGIWLGVADWVQYGVGFLVLFIGNWSDNLRVCAFPETLDISLSIGAYPTVTKWDKE